jgi:hypothetical protein
VHPTYDNARPNFRKQDGVGCESCHGAAQDWLTPHYLAAWQQADKKTHAMADTKSLPGRANVCVTCHVGTPDANVDHDLIAAGHPALRFEFSSYLANLPAHWDSKKDKKANSTGDYLDFEVRAWAAGQSASLAGAMDLLAYRADPANGKPWPEFAELDCFSCHHDLTARSWRQDKDHLEKRKPGSLVWNDWYAAFAPGYLQRYGLFEQPDRARIAHKALGIAKISRLEPLPRYPFNDPHSSGGLLISVASEAVLRNWQEATQHFLLLTAIKQMRQDNKQPTDARIEARIDKLRGEIAFPPGYNSPHWLGPPAVQEKK